MTSPGVRQSALGELRGIQTCLLRMGHHHITARHRASPSLLDKHDQPIYGWYSTNNELHCIVCEVLPLRDATA